MNKIKTYSKNNSDLQIGQGRELETTHKIIKLYMP